MSDDKGSSSWVKFIRENTRTSGDFAAFLLGSSVGVVVDIASLNVTLGQGLVGGGAAGLGIKKALEGKLSRRRLKKKVAELEVYYRDVERNAPIADAFGRLSEKIKTVKTLTADEIMTAIESILRDE